MGGGRIRIENVAGRMVKLDLGIIYNDHLQEDSSQVNNQHEASRSVMVPFVSVLLLIKRLKLKYCWKQKRETGPRANLKNQLEPSRIATALFVDALHRGERYEPRHYCLENKKFEVVMTPQCILRIIATLLVLSTIIMYCQRNHWESKMVSCMID